MLASVYANTATNGWVSPYSPSASPTFTGVASYPDGSAGAPSITNTGDTNTGVYFPAADQVGIVASGSAVIIASATGAAVTGAMAATGAVSGTTGTFSGAVSMAGLTASTGTFSGVVAFPDGSAAAPSITNTGDEDTGITWPAANQVGLSADGAVRVLASSAGATVTGAVSATGGISGTTGTFSGAVSMAGLTATTGAFSGAITGGYTLTTFTPGVSFGGASVGVTYNANRGGHYIQVGKMVFFQLRMRLTSKGSSTGSAAITGLPVAMISSGNVATSPCAVDALSMTGLTGAMGAACTTGATTVSLSQWASTGVASITDAEFTNTSDINISGAYPID